MPLVPGLSTEKNCNHFYNVCCNSMYQKQPLATISTSCCNHLHYITSDDGRCCRVPTSEFVGTLRCCQSSTDKPKHAALLESVRFLLRTGLHDCGVLAKSTDGECRRSGCRVEPYANTPHTVSGSADSYTIVRSVSPLDWCGCRSVDLVIRQRRRSGR